MELVQSKLLRRHAEASDDEKVVAPGACDAPDWLRQLSQSLCRLTAPSDVSEVNDRRSLPPRRDRIRQRSTSSSSSADGTAAVSSGGSVRTKALTDDEAAYTRTNPATQNSLDLHLEAAR